MRLAKLRWRVERNYQELKEEVGLDQFEGRSWRSFHHHTTLTRSPTVSSRSVGPFSPPMRTPWTLPQVRRHLQHLLVRGFGYCPLLPSQRRPPTAFRPTWYLTR